MSALPPKAEMCGAARDVRFGPIADSRQCLADLKIKQRWDRSRLENHMRPDKCRPWDRSLLSFFPLFKSARACLAPSFINMSSTTAFHCLPSGFPLSVWVCFCTFAVVALRSAKISTTLLSTDLSVRIRAGAVGAIYDRRHRIWVSTDDIRLILLYEIQERSLGGSFTRLHFAFDMATNYFAE